MRTKPRRFTIDFWDPEAPPPAIGDVVRSLSSKGVLLGYLRVVAWRRVKVRVSRGEAARYAVQMVRLEGKPPEGVRWTMSATTRAPKPDRFSPLLPP